jgi:hypothetical protein
MREAPLLPTRRLCSKGHEWVATGVDLCPICSESSAPPTPNLHDATTRWTTDPSVVTRRLLLNFLWLWQTIRDIVLLSLSAEAGWLRSTKQSIDY